MPASSQHSPAKRASSGKIKIGIGMCFNELNALSHCLSVARMGNHDFQLRELFADSIHFIKSECMDIDRHFKRLNQVVNFKYTIRYDE